MSTMDMAFYRLIFEILSLVADNLRG